MSAICESDGECETPNDDIVPFQKIGSEGHTVFPMCSNLNCHSHGIIMVNTSLK